MAQRLAPRPLSLIGIMALILVLMGVALPQTQAQTEARYFYETGHFLQGEFRAFWEANDGLLNFGYPITEEYVTQGRVVQYFERARFELTEQGGQAYIELGMLGVEITADREFPKAPPIEDTEQRRYFPQTQHILQYGFKEVWETRGGERIFGLPISEEVKEVLEDGEWHTVQYFERARFEYWPEFAPGERVLLSALGRQLAPPELLAPVPPDQAPIDPVPNPTPDPVPVEPLPSNVNAQVVPDNGPPGTVFQFQADGFNAGESVGVWLTAPDQSTVGIDSQVKADDQGSIDDANVAVTTDPSFIEGIWSFNAQGVSSGNQATGYFRITGAAASPPGDPNKLGVLLHDQLPVQGDAIIMPLAAPAPTFFLFQAVGYEADETVSSWITAADNTSTPIDPSAVTLDSDGIVMVEFSSAGLSDGIYSLAAQGVRSSVVNAAAFKITSDYVAGPGTPRPANVNGSVTPQEGGVGTTFQVRGQNLLPNEDLEFWVTDPTGTYVLFPGLVPADADGRIGYDPPLDLTTTDDAAAGVFGIHFRGLSSGTRVDVYFTHSNAARALADGQGAFDIMRQLSGFDIRRLP